MWSAESIVDVELGVPVYLCGNGVAPILAWHDDRIAIGGRKLPEPLS